MDFQQSTIEKLMNEKIMSSDILTIYDKINKDNNLNDEVVNGLNKVLINDRLSKLKKTLTPISSNLDNLILLSNKYIYYRFVSAIYSVATVTNNIYEVECVVKNLNSLIALLSEKNISNLFKYKIFDTICYIYELLCMKFRNLEEKNEVIKDFELELNEYYFDIFNAINSSCQLPTNELKRLVNKINSNNIYQKKVS
ncbi:MAG: hypothetical protein HFI86_00340 [Bacilli bacterium]|nr:hypothetical protein [Bacilli bacterium]